MTRKKFLFPTLICAFGLLTWGILAATAVPQALADYFITPDAYWQFSESGAPFVDEIASNSATSVSPKVELTTDPISDATGIVGTGVAFGGTSGLWVLDDSDTEVWDWAADASFAVEVWMKRNAADGGLTSNNETEVLIGRNDFGAPTTLHWFIGLRYNTGIGARVVAQLQDLDNVGSGVTLNGSNTSFTSVLDGNWHQVVLVRDAVALKNLLYVDGQLEDSVESITYTGGFATNTASLDIGWLGISGGSQTDFALNGSVDQVAFYSVAPTANEINQIYQIGQNHHALDDAFAPIYPAGTTDLGMSAQGYEVSFSAIPAANPAPTAYGLVNAPAGMTVSSSGLVSWMPTIDQPGVYTFSVTATNTEGTGSGDYTIEIVDPCATGLEAYWHLEEDGTSGYASTAGGDLTGQCSASASGGCPAQDTTTGKVNNAQIFTDTNGIDVAANASANHPFDWSAGDSFTIEMWMKRDATGLPSNNDTDVLIGRWDSGAGLQWWIGVRNVSGSLRLAAKLIAEGGENDVLITDAATGSDVTDGLWHHVALVRDAATTETRLYVDGVLEATDTHSYTANFTSTTVPLNIGYLGTDDTFGLNGSLDEVAMYNSALDAAVLSQHATENSGRGYCNSNPMITTAAVTTADPTLAYSYDADAADAEGDSVTWSLTTFPTGMTIDSSTGVVSWAQSDVASAAGTTVDVEILAVDAYGGTAMQIYNIAVSALPATAPQITGQLALSTTPGTALEIKVTDLTIVDSDSTVFTLTVMDGTNYTRSGNTITPDAGFTGDLTVPVKVNDGTLDSNTYQLTVTVAAAGSTTSTGGGSSGGCFIDSSRSGEPMNMMKCFGILLISLAGLVSATALGGRKNRID